MTSVTIELPEFVAAHVQSIADSQHVTVSLYLSSVVTDYIQQQRDYDTAAIDFLSRKPSLLQEKEQAYPLRDQLYDRSNIR